MNPHKGINIGLWNLRSLKDYKKKSKIVNMLHSLALDVILLVETWKTSIEVNRFARMLGLSWKVVSTNYDKPKRGCAVLYNSKKFTSTSDLSDKNGWFASTVLSSLSTELSFRCTAVYTVSTNSRERADHLNWLARTIPHHDNNIVAGDWNSVEVPTRDKLRSKSPPLYLTAAARNLPHFTRSKRARGQTHVLLTHLHTRCEKVPV